MRSIGDNINRIKAHSNDIRKAVLEVSEKLTAAKKERDELAKKYNAILHAIHDYHGEGSAEDLFAWIDSTCPFFLADIEAVENE